MPWAWSGSWIRSQHISGRRTVDPLGLWLEIFFSETAFLSQYECHSEDSTFINIPERAVTIGPVIWAWDVAFHFTQLFTSNIGIWFGMDLWPVEMLVSPIHTLKLLSSPAAKWRKIAVNCHYMHKHLYQISRLQFAIACGHWLLSLRIINP